MNKFSIYFCFCLRAYFLEHSKRAKNIEFNFLILFGNRKLSLFKCVRMRKRFAKLPTIKEWIEVKYWGIFPFFNGTFEKRFIYIDTKKSCSMAHSFCSLNEMVLCSSCLHYASTFITSHCSFLSIKLLQCMKLLLSNVVNNHVILVSEMFASGKMKDRESTFPLHS